MTKAIRAFAKRNWLAAACLCLLPVAAAQAGEGWWKPERGSTWHWQLQGGVDARLPVAIYDIDLFNTKPEAIRALQARGVRVLCYFSAGSVEDWRPDASAFPAAAVGKPLDGWPGERWLDIRSAAVRRLVEARVALAAQKGCDGVEPDNVDGFVPEGRSGFPLTAQDQLAFNRFLADTAHRFGLAAALKNDVDQAEELADEFDLAVNEQCHEYAECGAYRAFAARGKPVLNAEYAERFRKDAGARAALCTDAAREGLSTLVLPLQLDGSFRFACP